MLFLIMLDYLRPLDEVDAHLPAHRDFLDRHYAAGHFLLSGRKEPRTGGVILARADSHAQVSRWVAEDPFHKAGLARYDLVAWLPGKQAAALADNWLDPPPSGTADATPP